MGEHLGASPLVRCMTQTHDGEIKIKSHVSAQQILCSTQQNPVVVNTRSEYKVVLCDATLSFNTLNEQNITVMPTPDTLVDQCPTRCVTSFKLTVRNIY